MLGSLPLLHEIHFELIQLTAGRIDSRVCDDVTNSEKGLPWFTGYEVQISNAPRDDAHCTGSLYGFVAVKPSPDETADKWHKFEIQCKDSHITVTADSVKCIDHDQSASDKTKNRPLKGYIGLQDSHSSTGHYIEYRNVNIKVLD